MIWGDKRAVGAPGAGVVTNVIGPLWAGLGAVGRVENEVGPLAGGVARIAGGAVAPEASDGALFDVECRRGSGGGSASRG